MLKAASFAVAICGLSVGTVHAEESQLHGAVFSGVSACEKWILEPKTWSEDADAFPAKAGLGDKLVAIGGIPPGILPPGLLSSATNFWKIDAGSGSRVYVTASTTSPTCNVAGGGLADFQPDAELLVGKLKSGTEWKSVEREASADMTTDSFQFASDTKAGLMLTRASQRGGRTDRVQFLTTVFYLIGK